MTEQITRYHSLHCRELSVDQQTGELRYQYDRFFPVAQFIGPKPISPECDSFSIKIVDLGSRSCITIGLCHRRYSEDRQPGWDSNSIGYHADDGGIYHEYGFPRHEFGPVGEGEVMECSFNFNDRKVTFLRNGTEVFTSDPLTVPQEGFYPIVGLHSDGEVAQLLELEPWSIDVDTESQSKDTVFHSLFCREAAVSQKTGIVRYSCISPDNPVGQFVSMRPLSPEYNKFSIEIASLGQRSCISIGVCHRCYPSNCQPGWLPNSIAYHADDGGIYHGEGKPHTKGPKSRSGDVLSCEFDFESRTFTFRRNGGRIFQSLQMTIPPGGFHAALGFHSAGEAVCLLDREAWRSATDEFQPSHVPEKYYFTSCRYSSVDQTTGIVSYKGESSGTLAQLISKCPLTTKCNSFSVENLTPGSECGIAIGLCIQQYPVSNQLGYSMGSVGYHGNTGGVYIANSQQATSLPTVSKGDVINCQFNFSDNTVTFTINGNMVHRTNPLIVPPGGYHAVIRLHSKFESARLCETEPWRKLDHLPTVEYLTPPDERTTPKCCICIDKGVSRFLIPCGHTFCSECTEEWTAHHRTCPACRVHYVEVKMLFF